MRATWGPAVLRAAGLTVIEYPGCHTRGFDLSAIHVDVFHHTATTPAWSDQAVADLLFRGRPDLAGPIANAGVDRQGRWWWIASGRANHNGLGTHGNQTLGVEVFHTGTAAEPWNATQLRSVTVGFAALLRHKRYTQTRALGHKETDPRRKIDPYGIDMNVWRLQVANVLSTAPGSGGLFMHLSEEQERRIAAMAEMFFTGSPTVGVPPIHTALARVDRNVQKLGETLDTGMTSSGEIALRDHAQRVGPIVRHWGNTLSPEFRELLRAIAARTGTDGQPPPKTAQTAMAGGTVSGVDTEAVAHAVVRALGADLATAVVVEMAQVLARGADRSAT